MDKQKKLDLFKQTVIGEAEEKKDEILKHIQDLRESAVSEKESEILEYAYNTIQKKKAQTSAKSNQQIAKAHQDAKRYLIQTREEIADKVFADLLSAIETYKKEQKYDDFMMSCCKQAVTEVGDGEIVIEIDQSDERFAEAITSQFTATVKTGNILGGCKVYNTTLGRLSDYSLLTRYNQMHEHFLEYVDLSINI